LRLKECFYEWLGKYETIKDDKEQYKYQMIEVKRMFE